MTVAESIFAVPLIEVYLRGGYPIVYGYETACGGRRKVIRKFTRYKNVYRQGFSSFGKTVPAWLIDKAVFVLEMNLRFPSL